MGLVLKIAAGVVLGLIVISLIASAGLQQAAEEAADDAQAELDRLTADDVLDAAGARKPVVLESDDTTTRVRARIVRVLDPVQVGEYDAPEAGRRFVGVEVKLTNRSAFPWTADADATLIVSGDRKASDAYISGGPCGDQDGGAKLAEDESLTQCFPFEISEDAEPKRFELTIMPESGEPSSLTARWPLDGTVTR